MKKSEGLDRHSLELVRLAAAVAQGYEPELRDRMADVLEAGVPSGWVDELLLQSVLFVGYPRTLVAYSLWRKQSGFDAPTRTPKPTTPARPNGSGAASRPAPWSMATTTASCATT